MKPISVPIAVICLILTLVFFGVFTQNYLEKTTAELDNRISEINQLILDDNWDKSSENLEKFKKIWDEDKKTWQVLIDHNEIDNIDMTLSRVNNFISTHDKNFSLSELSVLKNLFSHIPEKESLQLVNVF